MIWNVYREDINARRIEVYNIFDHGSFYESVKKLMKKKLPKDDFSEALRQEVMYYFWSKCEHEITICSSPTYIEKSAVDNLIDEREKYMRDNGRYPFVSYVKMLGAEKIDVADQVRLNWDAFVNYVYSQI